MMYSDATELGITPRRHVGGVLKCELECTHLKLISHAKVVSRHRVFRLMVNATQ